MNEIKQIAHVIQETRKAIVSMVSGRDPEIDLLVVHNKIDESNLVELKKRALKVLNSHELDKFNKITSNLKKCVDYIIEEYYTWAMSQGCYYASQYGLSHIEGQSCGAIGLMKAAYRYRPTGSFEAYASMWIRQVIQRELPKEVTTLHSKIGDSDTLRIDMIEDQQAIDMDAYIDIHRMIEASGRDPLI